MIAALRKAYPDMLLVVKDATGDVIRLGSVGPDRVSKMLDGAMHQNVYRPVKDDNAQAELQAWAGMGLTPGGHPFWVATEDYASNCTNNATAQEDYAASRKDGFSPYVADAAGPTQAACFWPF